MKYIFAIALYLFYLGYTMCKVILFVFIMILVSIWDLKINKRYLKNCLDYFNLDKHELRFYIQPMVVYRYIGEKLSKMV